ncbi:MAG: MBL fold metallo-hydrolase [Dehalococcoidia bacterium]|nr:MBL fold metallo-hydrolase [Dehalococcoidia bacterium]
MIYHESVRLAENLYCYVWQGRGNNCNTILLPAVLRGERPHVLVDPGHVRNEIGEPCFNSLTQAMEKDGFKIDATGLVITTHSHPDHIEAAELVVKKSGALFALSREEDEFYRTAGKMLFQAFGSKPPQVEPFFYLKEGDLSLGAKNNKVEIKVFLTPGHSPGSISLYLEENKILITGDVVFAGSVGRTDFPGGSPSLLRKSIDKLSQLDVEYLIPGHSTEKSSIIAGKDKVRRNFYTVKVFI